MAITLLNKLDSELALDIRELSVKVAMCSALLRALNGAPNEQCKQQAIQNLLNSKLADNAEILSTIAVKMSQQLLDQETLQLFLEKLANSEAGQQGFSRIMADLMFSDNLRRAILQAFRNPQRSEKLSIAIGNMFGGKF